MNLLQQTYTLKRNTFKKEERLCGKKLIEDLFKQNQSFFIHPFKLIWAEMPLPTTCPTQLLINASKKHYKNAVDRNYVKRLIRESFRKNKHTLYDALTKKNKQVAISIICVAAEKLNYTDTEHKIVLLLQRLIKTINSLFVLYNFA